MTRRRYVPSGELGDATVAHLLLVPLGAAVAAGAAEAVVGRWFSLIIVFAAVIGAAAGYAAGWVIDRFRVRAPLLAGLLAGAAGLAGQATRHEVTYQMFVRELAARNEPAAQYGRLGYLRLTAALGKPIKRRAGRGAANLAGAAFWLVFAAEFLVAGGVAFSVAWTRARRPFCERCRRWYDPPTPVARGTAEKAALSATLAALRAADWPRFAETFGQSGHEHWTALLFGRCPACEESDRLLVIQSVTRLGHTRRKVRPRLDMMVSAEEARAVTAALAARGVTTT
jgi:hypothetical protein